MDLTGKAEHDDEQQQQLVVDMEEMKQQLQELIKKQQQRQRRNFSVLMVATHGLSFAVGGYMVPGGMVMGVVALLISMRLAAAVEADKSIWQGTMMVSCVLVAAFDLWITWICFLEGTIAKNLLEFFLSFVNLAAASASIHTAKQNTPSNIMEHRRRLTAYLMLLAHGTSAVVGTLWFPAIGVRVLTACCTVYATAALISLKLFTSKRQQNAAWDVLAMICCILVASADIWISWWWLAGMQHNYMWTVRITGVTTLAASGVSVYTAGTIAHDLRRPSATRQDGVEMSDSCGIQMDLEQNSASLDEDERHQKIHDDMDQIVRRVEQMRQQEQQRQQQLRHTVTAILVLVTHILSFIFGGFCFPAAWVACGLAVVVSARLFFFVEQDHTAGQAAIRVSCVLLLLADLWYSWLWLTVSGPYVGGMQILAIPNILAAFASGRAARNNSPSNMCHDWALYCKAF